MIIAMVILLIFSGIIVSIIGYFTPFMIVSSVFIAIGAGLLTTFTPSTPSSHWIGYQVIFGIGAGAGFQQPLIAVQALLEPKDIPIGTAIMVFTQTLGATVFLIVGQNVFANQLFKNLARYAPTVDAMAVFNSGATRIEMVVATSELDGVRAAYNHSINEVFYVATALASASILGSALVKWKKMG